MGTPDTILHRVTDAIDSISAAAETHGRLITSLLHRDTGTRLTTLPPSIRGQRDAEGSHLGSNLLYDQPLLHAIYALAKEGNSEYRRAADDYLSRSTTRCTDTETGLFPWGDHPFWHLEEDRVGNAYEYVDFSGLDADPIEYAVHDQRVRVPEWLWEKLHSFDEDAVQRFADGLDYHWTDRSTPRYNRHAPITERRRLETSGGRSCDFPRHSGYFILDWAFAHSQEPREEIRAQIRETLDYWWTRRDDRFVEWAKAAGYPYARVPFPDGNEIPAKDPDLALLADLYDVTGDTRWIEEALQLADEMLDVYLDAAIPRGAAGIDWYESQLGPSDLIHGLARVALVARDPEDCPLAPNYSRLPAGYGKTEAFA